MSATPEERLAAARAVHGEPVLTQPAFRVIVADPPWSFEDLGMFE
jgi:hypothetical protein